MIPKIENSERQDDGEGNAPCGLSKGRQWDSESPSSPEGSPEGSSAEQPSLRNQIVASLAVGLGHMGIGCVLGMSAIPYLRPEGARQQRRLLEQSSGGVEDSVQSSGSLQLMLFDDTLFNTAVFLAASLGCMATGGLQVTFGQKKIMLLALICLFFGWVVLATSDSLLVSLTSRVIQGLAWGAFFGSSFTYILEMSHARVRGSLVVVSDVFTEVGHCVVYGLADLYFERYQLILMFGFFTTLAPIAWLIWLPQSPRWLVYKNLTDEAYVALENFRGAHYDSQVELFSIQRQRKVTVMSANDQMQEMHLPAIIMTILFSALLLITVHFTYTQSSGVSVLTVTQQDDVTYSTAIVSGLIRLSGSIVCAVAVDFAGRKPLYVISFLLCSAASLVLGSLRYDELRQSRDDLNCLFVSIRSIFVFFGGMTFPLLKLWLGESFPTSVRSTALGFLNSLFYLAAVLASETHQKIILSIGRHGTLWLISFMNLSMAAIGWFWLPETKRKSLERITDEFYGPCTPLEGVSCENLISNKGEVEEREEEKEEEEVIVISW
ncbi:facilitated trehalose transporter Tret1-like [Macrobrachium rosenbergii]|uniref:facilitated trehalose transporter Tret1-like n=1 Tax=Macrobrachium rosenbergii TaxID=79674 RepID=UPI0034D46405